MITLGSFFLVLHKSMLWVVIRSTLLWCFFLSTHNICFYGEIRKTVPEASSDTPP